MSSNTFYAHFMHILCAFYLTKIIHAFYADFMHVLSKFIFCRFYADFMHEIFLMRILLDKNYIHILCVFVDSVFKSEGGCKQCEFSCVRTGQCVPWGARCDGLFHCTDGSDEWADACKADTPAGCSGIYCGRSYKVKGFNIF